MVNCPVGSTLQSTVSFQVCPPIAAISNYSSTRYISTLSITEAILYANWLLTHYSCKKCWKMLPRQQGCKLLLPLAGTSPPRIFGAKMTRKPFSSQPNRSIPHVACVARVSVIKTHSSLSRHDKSNPQNFLSDICERNFKRQQRAPYSVFRFVGYTREAVGKSSEVYQIKRVFHIHIWAFTHFRDEEKKTQIRRK